jgi:hypothetical protein
VIKTCCCLELIAVEANQQKGILLMNQECDAEGFGVCQCCGAFQTPMIESGAEPPHPKTLRAERASNFSWVHGLNVRAKADKNSA